MMRADRIPGILQKQENSLSKKIQNVATDNAQAAPFLYDDLQKVKGLKISNPHSRLYWEDAAEMGKALSGYTSCVQGEHSSAIFDHVHMKSNADEKRVKARLMRLQL